MKGSIYTLGEDLRSRRRQPGTVEAIGLDMFVLYYGGGGARGALFSIGLSLGLFIINVVPWYILMAAGLVVALLSRFVFRDSFQQLWPWLLRLIRRGGEAVAGDADPSHFDAVLSRLRTMPTEKWKPVKELTIHELRQRLIRHGKDNFIERSELESAYSELCDDVCPICAESWVYGDILRRLKICGHVFHIECIDRWAMTSADRGRTPLCPLCKSRF